MAASRPDDIGGELQNISAEGTACGGIDQYEAVYRREHTEQKQYAIGVFKEKNDGFFGFGEKGQAAASFQPEKAVPGKILHSTSIIPFLSQLIKFPLLRIQKLWYT